MKTKTLIVVLLVSMLLVDEVESWRIRIRGRRILRRIGRVIKPICRFACPRICKRYVPGGKFVCSFACSKICRGKRDTSAIEGEHETPLPAYLSFYDLDDDSLVSVVEFADALGHFGMESDLVLVYNMTDIDQDGMLNEDELFSSTYLNFAT